ncbi:hypothetical protein NDU88_005635 [Pleurodeles waltl]|uniref:Uncharacterized protein n=1 Tax=Pleurodeles waltl TaxID=8319 RepID=A0AAV7LXV0_PLEWA|nr:hypothetical protein NDU88_005635 [Pleurodeles waltl]
MDRGKVIERVREDTTRSEQAKRCSAQEECVQSEHDQYMKELKCKSLRSERLANTVEVLLTGLQLPPHTLHIVASF